MKVVIFKGKFQYDVVTDFGYSNGKVLKKTVHAHTWLNRLEELIFVVQAAKQYWSETVEK